MEQPERLYECKGPWLNVDLTLEKFSRSRTIPTLCEELSTKFFAWIIEEFKPKTVLEIGCWFGHSSVLMLESGKSHIQEMYCTDIFEWYPWMNKFYKEEDGKDNYNMLETFKKVTQGFEDIITPVQWDIEYGKTPEVLAKKTFDFVLVDFTTRGDELERGWKKIQHHLVPNQTIVVFHGILKECCLFFVEHASELQLIVNPPIRAKAFIFLGPRKPEQQESSEKSLEPNKAQTMKLKFEENPDWSHHHLNAFGQAINNLKKEFHDEDAHVVFYPSVENGFCESDGPNTKPWVGIIHEVVKNMDQFYVPDLKRLCSKSYRPWLKHCKGLFTLTDLQKEYLQKNLKLDQVIPIQTLFYPIIHLEDKKPRPNGMLEDFESKTVDLVLIGSFQRDFNFFYHAKVPKNIQKALLLGDEVIEREARDNCPKHIKLIPRASGEDYERLLENSIIFLSLKVDGMANTLVLEAISRNLPIIAPNLRSVCQYLGNDYPLLFDPAQNDLTDLIQAKNLEAAVQYLQEMDKTHLSQEAFCNSIRCQFQPFLR